MKGARFWKQIALSLHRLSPGTIRKDARRPFSLAIVGNPAELQHWMTALVPPEMAEPQRGEAMKRLFTIPVPVSRAYADMLPRFDLVLATPAAGEEVRQFTRAFLPVSSLPDPRGEWARGARADGRRRHGSRWRSSPSCLAGTRRMPRAAWRPGGAALPRRG